MVVQKGYWRTYLKTAQFHITLLASNNQASHTKDKLQDTDDLEKWASAETYGLLFINFK